MGWWSHSPISQTEEERALYTSTAGGFRQNLVFIPSLLNLTALQANALGTVRSIYFPAEAICLQLVSNETQFLGNLRWQQSQFLLPVFPFKQSFILLWCKRTAFANRRWPALLFQKSSYKTPNTNDRFGSDLMVKRYLKTLLMKLIDS